MGKIFWLCVFVFLISVFGGWELWRYVPPSVKRLDAKQNDAKERFAANVSMVLPAESVVFRESDGKPRDGTEFYSWAIYSRIPVVFPANAGDRYESRLSLDLHEQAQYVEQMFETKRILGPQRVRAVKWTYAEYEFRATLVHADHGQYMYIERFSDP